MSQRSMTLEPGNALELNLDDDGVSVTAGFFNDDWRTTVDRPRLDSA